MRAVAIAFALTVASGVLAQKSEWTFSGYVDGYFQYDFSRQASGDTVNGRGFDISNSRLRLAVAELDVAKTPTAKSPFGLTVQLFVGKNAELIHLTEPGGRDKYRFIRQAYFSYAAPNNKNSVQIDIGKFDTWIGYESIDSRYQDQYGRSFNWAYSEPVYETGLRVTGKLTDKLNGALYVVRGWNEVEDGNGGASIGAALTYAPNPKTTITIQNHYGDEGSDQPNGVGSYGGIGFSKPGLSKVHLLDLIVAYQLTDKTKIALNIDHATSVGGPNAGQWIGAVLYFKHQLSQAEAASMRLEHFEDKDGLRTGVPIQLHSLTASYDRILGDHVTLRLELRRDFSSQDFFIRDSGFERNRTTLSMAAIFRF